MTPDTREQTAKTPAPPLSRGKKVLFGLIALGFGGGLALGGAEIIARLVEVQWEVHGRTGYVAQPELGWLPPVGVATVKTEEYEATYDVNAEGMNDRPLAESLDRSRLRIMALGDSHTYALGVSQAETWPNVLEARLFAGDLEAGTVYNLGVIGYGVGQYLLRFRQMRETLRPQVVLIGFSMATDLYDLIPPRLGGFVYGQQFGRVYFDLDPDGSLKEVRDLVGKDLSQERPEQERDTGTTGLRETLNHSALYRRFKRSDLALWVATRLRPGGQSLWPGMDTCLKKELGPDDTYRWELAEAILGQLAAEARAAGMAVVLVNIPYLAQVYDETWDASFGAFPDQYDRWIGGRRMEELSARIGFAYIDTTPALLAAVQERGRWMHFPVDAHPTAEGHAVIAEAVAAGLEALDLLDPARSPAAPAPAMTVTLY